MAEEFSTKRIINLPDQSVYVNGDYVATDNATNGTKRFPVSGLVDAAMTGFASVYDATKTYAVGDFCVYGGTVYECTTAITTAEAWTAAHWKATTAGSEIANLKADLNLVKFLKHLIFTDAQKNALLDTLKHVAWADVNGQRYLSQLEEVFFAGPVLRATSSGSVSITSNLDDVKEILTVSLIDTDGTIETVPSSAYNLSGRLTVGTSVLSVEYMSLLTTVEITVTRPSLPAEYTEYSYITHSDSAPDTTNTGSYVGISTDIGLTSEDIIEVDLVCKKVRGSALSYSQCVFAIRASSNGTKEIGLFVNPENGRCGYWYGGVDSTNVFYPISYNVNTHVIIKPVGMSETYPDYATIEINGVEYSTDSSASDETWDAWMGLFAQGTSNSELRGIGYADIGMQIGTFIIYGADGSCKNYLIPAGDGANYGFYDVVNNKFYYNRTYSANFEGVA